MGEAFIFGSGGGATVEHIVVTDAPSQTFQLTNPRRTHCKVFGYITSKETTYANYYQGDNYRHRQHRLYGNQYMVSFEYGHYYVGEGWRYDDPIIEFDNDITITRNDGSITIDLNPSYPYYADEKWTEDEYGEYSELNRDNTIDIYVVDYD